jgi:predicted O-methyltransferase YrrM
MTCSVELERIAAIADTVDGWLSEAQGRALFEAAASSSGRGAIIEIGSWKGRSTVWLAAGAKAAGQRVFAVDRHVGSRENPAAHTLDQFRRNIVRVGVADAVEPLVMSSAEAAAIVTGPVELLFVDGDHSYEGAKRDADIWLPRVLEGGTVMFHDVATAGYDGPRRVVRRMICWSPEFEAIRRVGSMLIARRSARRTFGAAMWGGVAGLLLFIFDLKQFVSSLKSSRRAINRDRGSSREL